ncbi:GAP family protein [Halosimplex pelagicum]|uniref:GAP family protein n=1 Tax=Halosimplex pelagicum TaxID=869886 RepID=A0A7D5TF52_9EURY|nr:GAP family protein [Halosimplex pelagicum]QLH84235.1 GAP family protein [Halosimplex pelagicum]
MSFLTILPLAVVMVAGPQLLSAVFLATSREWRRNSALFVAGAALSISAVVALTYVLGGVSTGGGGESNGVLSTVVLVLIVAAMISTFLGREDSEPPKWMGKLEAATPRFSFRLGFLLLGVFPTDIVTSVAVGSYLAANDLPLVDAAPFVALTLLLLALPSLAVLTLGARAETLLPRVRDWMNDNAWIVNEVVLAFFLVLTLT